MYVLILPLGIINFVLVVVTDTGWLENYQGPV